jgi:hypothetical protein
VTSSTPQEAHTLYEAVAASQPLYLHTMRSGIWLTFALALAACGGSGPAAPDAFAGGEVCTPGGTFDLNGRSAVLGSLNVHINASGLVETDTTAEILIAMDVQQDGTRVAVDAKACAITIPDVPIAGQDQPIHLEVPAATVDSVADVTGKGTLSSPDQTCATFMTEKLTLVLGAILDPTMLDTSTLPSADSDGNFANYCPPSADTTCALAIGENCACDQEGDGLPGATLTASNVPAVNLDAVYVSLRTSFTLTGEVFSSDKVEGTIDATLEQGILGCHKESGVACAPNEVKAVKVLNPVVTQQPGNASLFRTARVPDGTTCADIIQMKDTLFPR